VEGAPQPAAVTGAKGADEGWMTAPAGQAGESTDSVAANIRLHTFADRRLTGLLPHCGVR
jgi:hypothetical protein